MDNRGEDRTTTTSSVAGLNNANNNDDDKLTIHDGGEGHNDPNDNLELYDNFAASVVKPNMQTLPPPKTPIMTDADAVNATMSPVNLTAPPISPTLMPPTSPIIGRNGSGRPPTGSSGQRSLSREASAEQKGSPYGSASM